MTNANVTQLAAEVIVGSGTTVQLSWLGAEVLVPTIYAVPSCCEEQIIVDPAIVALLANRDLRVAHLVELNFTTGVRRLWNGNRDLPTLDGRKWQGLKKLGAIAGMEEQGGIISAQMQFTISGVDSAVLSLAISEDRSTYVNQIVTVWLQFFDSNWQPVGNPIARNAGIMEGLKVAQGRDKDGVSTRTITLTAENIFYGRGSPPASYYTDRDQQQRSPGDRGLGFVVETQNTVIPIPW